MGPTGWKLAYVLKGWASERLLSTYDEERRVVAEELLGLDKTLTTAVESGADALENYQK